MHFAFPIACFNSSCFRYLKGGAIYRLQSRTDSQIQRTFRQLPDGRRAGGMGEKGEGIRKYKLVVTEQSWGCKLQHREHSQ